MKALGCPSIRFPVSWEHAALRPHRAELSGGTSDRATAQLGQTSPTAEGTSREGPRFTQQMPIKSRKKIKQRIKLALWAVLTLPRELL